MARHRREVLSQFTLVYGQVTISPNNIGPGGDGWHSVIEEQVAGMGGHLLETLETRFNRPTSWIWWVSPHSHIVCPPWVTAQVVPTGSTDSCCFERSRGKRFNRLTAIHPLCNKHESRAYNCRSHEEGAKPIEEAILLPILTVSNFSSPSRVL